MNIEIECLLQCELCGILTNELIHKKGDELICDKCRSNNNDIN